MAWSTCVSAETQVLIVGAGPGGSAAATLLARSGLGVTLVDRAAFPREKACSEYLSPEALRILARLGALEDLEPLGAPLYGTTVHGPRGARLDGAFARAGHQPFRPTGLSIARRLLDARLVAGAVNAGAELLERHAVEDLIYDAGAVAGAVVRDARGRRRVIRSRLTIGADGLRSIVARRLGRQRTGHPRRIAFVAHVAGVTGLSGSAEMHVGADGYVGLNDIGQGIANVALVVPAARARDAGGRAEDFFFRTVDAWAGVHGRVGRADLARRVMVTGPFAATASRVTADGALLLGDAADFFDPFTGEGIYSALRGAELLAETADAALAGPGRVTADAMAPYRRARLRAFCGKWAVERLIGYGMHFPDLFDRAVERLARRGLAHTLIGVTGDFVPARAVLNPVFLARMLL
jgi:menaquinone-9 beta-reductase